MLLGWPGVEFVGITTTADPGGRRAGYVAHCLKLAVPSSSSAGAAESVPLAGSVGRQINHSGLAASAT